MPTPESAAALIGRTVERLRRSREKRKIVFPEGDDGRVQAAAARLAREDLIEPVLIGKPAAGLPGVTFIDPGSSPLTPKYAQILHERRRGRGMTQMEAGGTAAHRLYFAALMTAAGDAQGFVGSAVHTTAETVRAVLHSIDRAAGVRLVSSAHLLAVHNRSYGHDGLLVFSDCAIVADPSAAELAEIAISSAHTTRTVLNTEPLVALLSFSTKGSARHKLVDKVTEALKYVRARAPELNADGELQADAALVPEVGQSKSPGSVVAGRANTLIFPDLNSANIGHKLVERLGDGALLAVLLQGLAKPASLISRGCSAEDAYHTAILTAAQSLPAGA